MKHQHTDIIILGAGIAGYEAYRNLAKQLKRTGSKQTITLVDQNNYFTFVPLLHEVASGSVLPSHASFPLREVVANTPHTFLCGTVSHVDPKKKEVTINETIYSYDTCVVALGSISNMFNVPGSKEYAYRVRTLDQAIALNQTLICKLEESERTELHINIVGGGYTGIEIASEFAELKRNEIKTLYPHIRVSISIIQAADKLVPLLPARARNKIIQRLEALEVTHVLGTPATKVTSTELHLGNTAVQSDLTIWVTGFTTLAPTYFDEAYIEHARVPVTNHLHIENYPDTYVIGDMAMIHDPDNDDIIYPQLGEAAHHEGVYVAKHIVNKQKKKAHKHFHFKSKGQLMPVGEWYGIGIFGPFVFSGRFMWWLRRTVYVLFMPGIIRKLRIVADWTFVDKQHRHMVKLHQD